MADKAFDFRSWLRDRRHTNYTTDFSDDDHYRLETDYATAQINFYRMEPDPEVVEFLIENKADGETKFFLHFHPEERDHAIQLFREMTQALIALREQQTTEVLLCCTVGMTTTFFADRLNQVAETLGLDWHFSAVAASEAVEHGQSKAAVLVAPQIGYQAKRLQAMIPNVPVLPIPTATFASYDAAGCLEWLRKELAEREKTVEDRALDHIARDLVNDKRVFVVASHSSPRRMVIHYRLYDCGRVTLDQKVIKRTLAIKDITDVIDTQVCGCTGTVKADAVGIALPGIIGNGKYNLELSNILQSSHGNLDLSKVDLRNFDIEAYFGSRYSVPVYLCNNANAAALGWYGSQDEYERVTFHSQATGWAMGGQGHVMDGKLMEGAHGIAGELRFFANRLTFSRPLHFSPYSSADVLELVGQELAVDCATFDPEVIALRCDLLPNVEEVADEIAKYVPREYMPKIVHVDNYNECILLGMMIHCLQKLLKV